MATKLIAGHAVRRVRRRAGLTQAAMAEALGISPSYLNLVERNQRPVSATLLVRLAERFDFDARALAATEPGGGAAAIRRRLGDPMFADLELDRDEVEEWLAAAPGGAEAFARAFDRLGGVAGTEPAAATDPLALVRREIERWRNHFPDLDSSAEVLADELRLVAADLHGALVERRCRLFRGYLSERRTEFWTVTRLACDECRTPSVGRKPRSRLLV